MSHTLVKICGITSLEDAEVVASAGAHAIGLVFAESPRQVDPQLAAQIVQALPPFVTPVALFVNESAETIRQTCEYTNINCVQLHGTEAPNILDQLTGLRVIKAFRIADAHTISGVRLWLKRAQYWPSGLLFDAYSPRAAGGTGETFDWSLIPEPDVRGDKPSLILAGGLDPSNVAQAIEQVRPYSVDVSSGVESEPGKKDHARVQEFIDAVRQAG